MSGAPVTPGPSALAPAERLGRLEDPNRDFPFYNGVPVALSGRQWGLVLAAVVMGFAVLVAQLPWPGGAVGAMVPAVLFAALPLMALARVAPGHASVLFGRVGLRELRLVLGFALLNIVVSMSVGAAVGALTEVSSNSAAEQLSGMDTAGRVAFFARTVPQLLGEELVTVLPFLAILQGLTRHFGVGRRRAIVVAWLVSSLVFGLMHLPTYDWNLVQCVVIIGTARGVLTLPWILTKNLWVSTGAHIVNDWLLFSLGLLAARLVAQG